MYFVNFSWMSLMTWPMSRGPYNIEENFDAKVNRVEQVIWFQFFELLGTLTFPKAEQA